MYIEGVYYALDTINLYVNIVIPTDALTMLVLSNVFGMKKQNGNFVDVNGEPNASM
jgi:hypothetical protein